MVKSERYTCKKCNRMYSSASSLCNHTTKFHTYNNNNIDNHNNHSYNHNNSIDNHSIIIDNPTTISTKLVEVKKTYQCKICNKEYDFTTEFCDENRFRKCSECIIKDLFILRCECNVCREIVEANLIIPK